MTITIRIENSLITSAYIQYLWVYQQYDLNDKTVIYILSEYNFPILKITRLFAASKE